MSRAAWVLTGAAFLIWLAVEDRGLMAVQWIGAAIVASGLLTIRARRPTPAGWAWWLARGAAAGALVGVAAAILILVKTGAHAHPLPDFTATDVTTVLGRMPLWALLGGIAGLGGFLLDRAGARQPPRYDPRGTMRQR